MLNYKEWLFSTLKRIMLDNKALYDSYNVMVFSEQDFVKIEKVNRNDILIVVKDLPSNFVIGGKTQPKQIMILSEENGLNVAKALFDTFTQQYNYFIERKDNDFIKHEYSSPTVVNNFMPVLSAYRSILYVSATLTIAENIIDIDGLVIDGIHYKNIITTNFVYNMTPDTQPTRTDNFVSSTMHLQSLALSMTVPILENPFTDKIIAIVNNQDSGNSKFNFNFRLCGYGFDIDLILTSFSFTTTINGIPSMQVGFTL